MINLALPNETLGSFSSGNPDTSANSLYSSSLTNQNMAFMHDMATQLAAGNQISTVTISLGTSDIMNILNSPGFGSMSLIQQATAVQTGLAQIQSEYTSLMSEIRNVLPDATIDLVGAYNPFHATPNSPLAPIAEPAFLGLDNILQQVASTNKATYVNTYTSFLGNEGTYTNILGGTGNINPTAAGFSAIAAQLSSTVVPEPSTLFIAALGLAGPRRPRPGVPPCPIGLNPADRIENEGEHKHAIPSSDRWRGRRNPSPSIRFAERAIAGSSQRVAGSQKQSVVSPPLLSRSCILPFLPATR